MKKALILILAAFLTAGFYAVSYAGIGGTAHDFSGRGWNDEKEMCNVCHTPHHAETSYTPLWNHEVTTASYTLYTSATLDATTGQPQGESKLCLSCHDGTVAIDSYGGKTGIKYITGNVLIGTDLTDDHPISFTYDSALVTADGGLNDPSGTGLPLFGTGKDQLECTTCHNAHDDNSSPFLRKDNANSALCTTCHAK